MKHLAEQRMGYVEVCMVTQSLQDSNIQTRYREKNSEIMECTQCLNKVSTL